MTDQDIMPFGKYKGRRLEDVPAKYLLWLWDDGVHADPSHSMHSYIKNSLSALETEVPDYIIQHPVSR